MKISGGISKKVTCRNSGSPQMVCEGIFTGILRDSPWVFLELIFSRNYWRTLWMNLRKNLWVIFLKNNQWTCLQYFLGFFLVYIEWILWWDSYRNLFSDSFSNTEIYTGILQDSFKSSSRNCCSLVFPSGRTWFFQELITR